MPTVFTHAFIGAASVTALGAKKEKGASLFIAAAMFCSSAPDLDVIGFVLGIPYNHFLGHRGFFHSLFFAGVFSFFISFFLFRKERWFSGKRIRGTILLVTVSASHGVLDALTNGGLGIALLSPFDDTRYFFPWTPIPVSPIGLRSFLSSRGMRVVFHEILFIWLPLSALIIIFSLVHNGRKKERTVTNRY